MTPGKGAAASDEPPVGTLDALQYRRLLVAIDGSASSLLALSIAIEIAHRHNASLTLITVSPDIERTQAWAAEAESPEQMQREADAELESTLHDALTRIPNGVEARTILRRGVVGQTIVEQAAEAECDAILLGARGLGKIAGALGSVSQYVLHHADRAVIVAHEKATDQASR